MEPRHKQFILRNLTKLVELTDCNVSLRTHLQSTGVISENECQQLQLLTLTRMETAEKLYKIVITKKNCYGILLEALNRTLQSGAAAVLLEGLDAIFDPTFDSESDEDSQKFGYVQDPSPLFVGREKELKELHKLLNESNKLTLITHITSVSGLGGIGKTQLARKYAVDYKTYYDNNVIWLNAESEGSLGSSFRKLATDKLGISTKNANDEEKTIHIVVQECYEYFQHSKCLFVFDNVEKDKYLKEFLPRKHSSKEIYVLITSRHQDWGKSVGKLEINVFSEEEAMTFVKTGLEIEGGSFDDEISIKLLVSRLQYFPLAIGQAISYISNQQEMDNYSVKKYLEEFEVNSAHLLDRDMSNDLESDYGKTTFTTWKMTIEKIAQTPEYGYVAVNILNVVAYFAPDNIHRDIFLIDNSTNDIVKQAINLLVKYSMVTAKKNQSIFSIHRLVQEVIRIDLRRTGKENGVIVLALQFIEISLCEKYLAHAISVWNYGKCVPDTCSKFVELGARILKTFVIVGAYTEGCQFGVNNLEFLQNSPEVNKQSILEFECHLAHVFMTACQYESSLYHLQHVEEECSALGNNDPFLLIVQKQIACVFDSQGRYSEALELALKICQKTRSIFGKGHSSTAETFFTAAAFARNMGKHDLSYSTFQEGFTCYERASDKDEVGFLRARHNFALLICEQGDFNEALGILEEVHAKIIASSSLEVPIELKMNTMCNIGNCLNGLHKYGEAYKILAELYSEEKSVFGEDHRDTLVTLIELGRTLLLMKKFKKAYSACNTAHMKMKEKFGEQSVYSLLALRWVALVLSFQGQHSTSILHITTVVEIFERTMDYNSRFVLGSKLIYADILARARKYEEALSIVEEVKESYLQLFGADNSQYLNCVKFISILKLRASCSQCCALC